MYGVVTAYVPIFEFLVCKYNKIITAFIFYHRRRLPSSRENHVYSFLYEIWTILDSLFDYQPPLSVRQFLIGENPIEMMYLLSDSIRKVRVFSPAMQLPFPYPQEELKSPLIRRFLANHGKLSMTSPQNTFTPIGKPLNRADILQINVKYLNLSPNNLDKPTPKQKTSTNILRTFSMPQIAKPSLKPSSRTSTKNSKQVSSANLLVTSPPLSQKLTLSSGQNATVSKQTPISSDQSSDSTGEGTGPESSGRMLIRTKLSSQLTPSLVKDVKCAQFNSKSSKVSEPNISDGLQHSEALPKTSFPKPSQEVKKKESMFKKAACGFSKLSRMHSQRFPAIKEEKCQEKTKVSPGIGKTLVRSNTYSLGYNKKTPESVKVPFKFVKKPVISPSQSPTVMLSPRG